jgi:hypothetical protein
LKFWAQRATYACACADFILSRLDRNSNTEPYLAAAAGCLRPVMHLYSGPPMNLLSGVDNTTEMNAAMEEAQRADQKKREAAEVMRARQYEYETANLRGRQRQMERARAALEAAQAAYQVAKRDVQRA